LIYIESFALLKEIKAEKGVIMFDKDDNLAMKFVSALSNIRSHIFNIPLSSEWTIKEMAGNIVPAIASTNAIVSSIQISEAIKFLYQRFIKEKNLQDVAIPKNKELYVQNTKASKIIDANLGAANPECLICGDGFMPTLTFANFEKTTLQQFLEEIRKSGENLKDFIVNHGTNELYEMSEYLEEDEIEAYEKKASKTLKELLAAKQTELSINNEGENRVTKYMFVHDPELQENEFKIKKSEKPQENKFTQEYLSKFLDAKSKEAEERKENLKKKPQTSEPVHINLLDEEDEKKNGGGHPEKKQNGGP